MLSIIISTYQPKYYDALVKNISETIGFGFIFEIIQIENPGLMSIAEAYNLGITKAEHQNLLFLHEDVLFHTHDWGEKLLYELNVPDTGVLGVAGSDYVPIAPCSWTVVSTINRNYYHLYQGDKTGKGKKLNSNITQKKEVFAVDGVFLAVKKSIAKQMLFDVSISGFHGYDLDFSLRVSRKFRNFVMANILVEHFSAGNVNKNWFQTNIKIRKKLGNNFQKQKVSTIERETYQDFLQNYFKYFPFSFFDLLRIFRYYPWFAVSFYSNFKIINYLRYILTKNKI